MSQKSMVDIAYEYAKQIDQPIAFKDIWDYVVKELNMSEEEANQKIGIFYTNLSLDCRFHNQGDNTWIIRSKLLFDDATADIFLVKEDVDEENEDDEDSEDNDEYLDEEDDDGELDEDNSSDDDSLDNDMYESDEE